MITTPTPTQAKTREEWERQLCSIADSLSASKSKSASGAFGDSIIDADDADQKLFRILDAIMSMQAEAKQLDGDKWLLNRKIEIALDEYGKLKASATKLQAENQELYQSLCSTNTQYGQLEESEKELRAEVERLRDIVAEVHSMAVQAGIRGEFIPTDFIRSAIEKARQPNVRLHP